MKDKLFKLHQNSYVPISHFPVSACVVTRDGREFFGVNVEDASTRAGTCAERSAIFHAITDGVKKEDLDIDIDKNYLTINAKKEESKKEDTKGFRKSEFRYGEFSRTVYFPQEIDVEKTKAKLEHGILKIDAPKKYSEKEAKKKLIVK